ncbi:MAG: hypothetical protein WAN60_08985, partial [Candidatus Sulfotelmatobacter sp.]
WTPFYELLATARDHAEGVYGLDCMPREDLRKIGARDRHAAAKIAEIRQRHPSAAIFVLFGESHLAPGHLPRVLHVEMPGTKVLTVLQNVDALYWRAAGERADKVEAVRVREDVLCVFNATPLEKYESYRLLLDQWSRCEGGPDFAPTLYNLIDSLVRFLEIDRYSSHNGTQPKFLVDMMPEVYGRTSDAMLRRLLARKGVSEPEMETMLAQVEQRGSIYLAQVNAFYVREFQMMHAAEDAARFLHQACQGLPRRRSGGIADQNQDAENCAPEATLDTFYARIVEHAVAYFGSRVLCPSRPSQDREDSGWLSRAACEKVAQSAVRGDAQKDPQKVEASAQEWGYRIGGHIYDAYLAGKVKPSGLRRLFLAHLEEPGLARKVCATMIAKARALSRAGRS